MASCCAGDEDYMMNSIRNVHPCPASCLRAVHDSHAKNDCFQMFESCKNARTPKGIIECFRTRQAARMQHTKPMFSNGREMAELGLGLIEKVSANMMKRLYPRYKQQHAVMAPIVDVLWLLLGDDHSKARCHHL